MIARIIIPLLLLIVLSDVYIDIYFFRKRIHLKWWTRLLWWIPTIVLVVYSCILASLPSFAPQNLTWLNTYLCLLGVIVGPKVFFSIFSILGAGIKKYIVHTKRNPGNDLGIIIGIVFIFAYIYGLTIGVQEIKVRKIELFSDRLPPAFDGYRIVHVSDMHIGTFKGWREKILKAEMDSIRQLKADRIFFTGDLQNMRPEEVETLAPLIKDAMKGTVCILGNHDYTEYVKLTPEAAAAQQQRLERVVTQKLGWKLLKNNNFQLRFNNDSIAVCGGENDGRPPFPQKINMEKTMQGIDKSQFTIMLQHDPSAWRRNILSKTTVQLTLSGHTHGGQMQLFGLRPTMVNNTEDYGFYQQGNQYLNVTAGLGGLIPFRFNMPNEIVVITLRAKK